LIDKNTQFVRFIRRYYNKICTIFDEILEINIFLIMKRLIIILVIVCSAISVFSQKVYVTEWKSEADKKVYITEWKSEADMFVYKTSWKSEAKPDSGFWYYTEWKSEADWKIYFTTWKSEADIKVYFTEWKSEAGWKKK
jgi:hypothetical protein